MKNVLCSVFFTAFFYNLSFAQNTFSKINPELAWVDNKNYTLSEPNPLCADSITLGGINFVDPKPEDEYKFGYVKYIETKAGKKVPSIQFIAPKTSKTREVNRIPNAPKGSQSVGHGYAKTEMVGDRCVSLYSDFYRIERFESGVQEGGSCEGVNPDVFVSSISVTKSEDVDFSITVTKTNRYRDQENGNSVGDLKEEVITCVYKQK
ncbi:MAG: hypothetical protein QE271_03250 [Bacteriovoracaceae bacterium]|nr:hypothetical protein [Bacteriovoracaceae bacterium]